jgi:replicative DNA helicase
MLLAALNSGAPSLYFSFEAGRHELSAGLVEALACTRFPTKGAQPSREQGAALAEGVARLAELPVWIDDSSSLPVEEIVARIRAHKQAYGIKVAFVDYLQDILRSTNLGRDDLNYAYISQSLRRCAQDEDVAIVGFSQLGDVKQGEQVMAKHTAYSQQFGKDAVAVLVVERDQTAKSETMRNVSRVRLVKNRVTGRLGEEFMRYDHHTTRLMPCKDDGSLTSTIDVAGYEVWSDE